MGQQGEQAATQRIASQHLCFKHAADIYQSALESYCQYREQSGFIKIRRNCAAAVRNASIQQHSRQACACSSCKVLNPAMRIGIVNL